MCIHTGVYCTHIVRIRLGNNSSDLAASRRGAQTQTSKTHMHARSWIRRTRSVLWSMPNTGLKSRTYTEPSSFSLDFKTSLLQVNRWRSTFEPYVVLQKRRFSRFSVCLQESLSYSGVCATDFSDVPNSEEKASWSDFPNARLWRPAVTIFASSVDSCTLALLFHLRAWTWYDFFKSGLNFWTEIGILSSETITDRSERCTHSSVAREQLLPVSWKNSRTSSFEWWQIFHQRFTSNCLSKPNEDRIEKMTRITLYNTWLEIQE